MTTPRRFAVYARHTARHHALLVTEPSFEAAAVAFIERMAEDAADQDVSIVVHDLENGHEHCFRVDLETGETTACA